MKTRKLNGWKIGCLLLAVVLIVLLYNHMADSVKDTYTVRLYRTDWNEAGDSEVRRSITPQKAANFTFGSNDAKPDRVLFDGGKVHCGSGYGPGSLQGAFAAAEVNSLYGREVLMEDWGFSISAFKTSNDKILDYYLSIELPVDPEDEVVAALMVFYDGHPSPVVYSWTGALGQKIAFGIEV